MTDAEGASASATVRVIIEQRQSLTFSFSYDSLLQNETEVSGQWRAVGKESTRAE